MVDLAEVPALDFLLDKLHVLAAAPVEDDAEHAVGTARRVDDPLAFLGRWGQRFLDHDVFAGFQRGEGHRHMQDVRHGDGHRFDVGVGDKILVVAIDARNVELLGQVPAALFVEPRDGDDLSARDLGEPLQVQESDAAADDADLRAFRESVHLHPIQHRARARAWHPPSVMASRSRERI